MTATTIRMAKGRRPTGFEDMPARPGFRATDEQFAWFDQARIVAGEPSLSEWLRKLAVAEAERLLHTKYPPRKPLPPPRGKR
jgi:hypothetical protein